MAVSVWSKIIAKTARVLRFLQQTVTVKVLSEGGPAKVVNFHITPGIVVLLVVTFLGLSGGTTYLAIAHAGGRFSYEPDAELLALQASLAILQDEVAGLIADVNPFVDQIERIRSLLPGQSRPVGRTADLRSLLENVDPSDPQQIRNLNASLRNTAPALEQVHSGILSVQEFLREIPNYWPVVAGRGTVTMEYGPRIHPFTGQWYLHRGFDIADSVGVPIVASADGVVVATGYDQFNHGWNIIIRHKYGFRTRYSHLSQIWVTEGQTITQAQQIGALGSTGLSTGPHVHFEVHLGNNVLDPAVFLQISNQFARRMPRRLTEG